MFSLLLYIVQFKMRVSIVTAKWIMNSKMYLRYRTKIGRRKKKELKKTNTQEFYIE